jgi:hypothetical protein
MQAILPALFDACLDFKYSQAGLPAPRNNAEVSNSDESASRRRQLCRQLQIADWKSLIPGDILDSRL